MNSTGINTTGMPRARQLPLPGTARGTAFGQIVRNEVRLARRQPLPLIGSIGLPVILLIIFGSLPSSNTVVSTLGGLTLFDAYLPIIMMTGHSERSRVMEARDAGVTEFVASIFGNRDERGETRALLKSML